MELTGARTGPKEEKSQVTPGTRRALGRNMRLSSANEQTAELFKNRHWYNMKPAFWRTTFDVKVVVGPADLSFQL
jgi:hypothetical protein